MAIISQPVKLVLSILVANVLPILGLEREPLIIGGLPVEQSGTYQFPYQVLFYNQKYRFNCGGALISTFHILTAAHCVKNVTASQIEITAGSSHPSRLGGSHVASEQTRTGAFVYIHDKYNSITHINDISIIRVETPFTYSSHVQSIILPMSGEEFNGTATVSGWGLRTVDTVVSKDLYYVDMPMVPFKKCRDKYPNLRNEELCAGSDGHDHCKGDSGGPVTCKRSWNNEKVLCGIVSKGTCGTAGLPGTNTKVSSYISWIEETKERSDRDAKGINNVQGYGNQFNKKPNLFADRNANQMGNHIQDYGNQFHKKPNNFVDRYPNQIGNNVQDFGNQFNKKPNFFADGYGNQMGNNIHDYGNQFNKKPNLFPDRRGKPTGNGVNGYRNPFDNWKPTRFNTADCKSHQFRCTENSKCIPVSYKCNGYNDCPSGSDEYDCPSRSRSADCSKYQFRCTEGSKCIPSWHRCDNYRDCPDDSDETGCSNRNYK